MSTETIAQEIRQSYPQLTEEQVREAAIARTILDGSLSEGCEEEPSGSYPFECDETLEGRISQVLN